MKQLNYLQIHPDDDMFVALKDLPRGGMLPADGSEILLTEAVAAKHKFAARSVAAGELLKMYGIVVGRALADIGKGSPITTQNLVHATGDSDAYERCGPWRPPDVSRWQDQTFQGYLREDGRVATRNHWVVIPLVFCENRNLSVMRDALIEELGYGRDRSYQAHTRQLIQMFQSGADSQQITEYSFPVVGQSGDSNRVFENLDGIKFLMHESGCGCSYADSESLCGLLAGYINHPNVAGATVFSLGCQKAQIDDLQRQIHQRNPDFKKPLYILEQQQIGTEQTMLERAIKQTFAGLMRANQVRREAVALSHLCLGVECGGSDGFSGISANPAMGHCSDLLVALGGTVVLSEFPELAGCEADLASRCVNEEVAQRFLSIMKSYEQHVINQGDGFDANPTPGNIRDGLITDAMKSAGAARKGGSSPVVAALDYPASVTQPGLNLLCTPGGDVESTTAMAGSGATVMLFSTGLGTPTGNVVTPVIKVASNTELAQRMPDIIDIDTGSIVRGEAHVEDIGEQLFAAMIAAASGTPTKAEQLGQDDFIPWKKNLTF